ncbi:MAG: hypothetical protein ACK4NX_02755, partial [Candidatus Paceibacteria bacterium]
RRSMTAALAGGFFTDALSVFPLGVNIAVFGIIALALKQLLFILKHFPIASMVILLVSATVLYELLTPVVAYIFQIIFGGSALLGFNFPDFHLAIAVLYNLAVGIIIFLLSFPFRRRK